jgi:hypothetical protein
MASKYDDYWSRRLNDLTVLIESAAEGRPASLELVGLEALGQRASWYGSAVVRAGDYEASMAHMVSLAKLVARAGLCAEWPSMEFRFTVSQPRRLTVTARSGAAMTPPARRVMTLPVPLRPSSDVSVWATVDAGEACTQVHRLLDRLPILRSSDDVPFDNGLYFFYETGEGSEHAPAARIVRIGNHPRAQNRLKGRLRDHYRTRDGAKNGSVFRRYLGGALIRRDEPSSACLLPGPGEGHWEHQGGSACDRCAHYEDRVTEYLRGALHFRCVRIDDMAERNRFEGLLIATIAACPVCRPSSTWLGRHAYSPVVQASGLWNSDFVGGSELDSRDLDRLRELVDASFKPSTITATSDTDLSDTLLVLPCCQSKRGRGTLGLPATSMAELLSPGAAESLAAGRIAAFDRSGTRIDRLSGEVPALVRYTGQPFETAGLRDALVSLMRAGLHCVIVSGGYGLLRPEEPIHDYEAPIQKTAPVWRRKLPALFGDYIERHAIRRSFGAFSRQYASVVPPRLTGNDWRAVPLFSRGDEGSAYHEVPRRVGSAVMRLINARFQPARAGDEATPWLPT